MARTFLFFKKKKRIIIAFFTFGSLYTLDLRHLGIIWGKPRRWYHGKLLEGNDKVLHPINPGQGLSNFQEKSTSKCNITAPYFLISTWLLLMLFYCYNIIVQFLASCFPVCNQTNVSSWICCVITLCTSIHCCYFIFKISEFSHHFIQITPDVKTAYWNNITLTVRNCLSQHGARPDVSLLTGDRGPFYFEEQWPETPLCFRACDCVRSVQLIVNASAVVLSVCVGTAGL